MFFMIRAHRTISVSGKLRVTAHQLLVLEDCPRLSSLNNRDVTMYQIL